MVQVGDECGNKDPEMEAIYAEIDELLAKKGLNLVVDKITLITPEKLRASEKKANVRAGGCGACCFRDPDGGIECERCCIA